MDLFEEMSGISDTAGKDRDSLVIAAAGEAWDVAKKHILEAARVGRKNVVFGVCELDRFSANLYVPEAEEVERRFLVMAADCGFSVNVDALNHACRDACGVRIGTVSINWVGRHESHQQKRARIALNERFGIPLDG